MNLTNRTVAPAANGTRQGSDVRRAVRPLQHAPEPAAASVPLPHDLHIAPHEWRWTITLSSLLVFIAFIPLLWVAVRGTETFQFMGMLHNYQDGASYLSKMMLGARGEWLLTFQHTPDVHNGAFIQVLYLLLGHLSRVSGIPALILFHVARACAALAMYAAIYQLGAVIWARVRSRRLFFGIAAFGSGLGWLFAPLLNSSTLPDLTITEIFPFYSTLMNVHFPLTIALLAVTAALFIIVFRPGSEHDSTVRNGWGAAGLLSVSLAFLYPQALVPIAAAVAVFLAALWWRDRRLNWEIARWVLAFILPALPIAAYTLLIVRLNPAMAEWNRQNVTVSPPPWELIIGLGIPLLVALPALWRSARRLERDGDRLMLLWFAAMVIAVYLPTNVQRRFAVGMMLPVAYFATRAIEDVWLKNVARRVRQLAPVLFFPLISVSSVLVLFLPALPAIAGRVGDTPGAVFLPRDYVGAFEWLKSHSAPGDVILASPLVSAWIPGWAERRVVYGHPYETLYAEERLAEVTAWFAADQVTNGCTAILTEYRVRYVIVGPEEGALGENACVGGLRPVVQSETVTIYAP